jgi:4-amino-4-deoxy-L-arabinose transferase-like glycosyltransferase
MKKKTLIILIIISLLISYFVWLGLIGLRAEEPRRALISIEMLLTGEYVIPHMFGWVYYNKPPLFNWVMAFFFWLFGSWEEWVVRLPSTFSFLLIGVINWKIVSKAIDKETGILSSLFLVTAADILLYGSVNTGEIDLFYSLVVYLQLISIFIFHQRKSYLLMFVLSYFLAALGFLTKGLPSIAFQGLTILGYLLYTRDYKLLYGWKHFVGIALFLAVVGLYLWGLGEHATGFLIRQFKEASQRTGVETGISETILGFFTFPFQLIKLLLPWSLFLFFIIRRGGLEKLKQNPLIVFSSLFLVINLPLYWLTGDFKARYIYPFFPFFTIIISYFFLKGIKDFPMTKVWLENIFGGIMTLLPLLLVVSFFIPVINDSPRQEWVTAILFIVSVGLVYYYFKERKWRVYFLILFMILLKMTMNNLYLQSWSVDPKVNENYQIVEDIIEITGDEPIRMSGRPHAYPVEYTLGPLKLNTRELSTSPIMIFQIPYLLTLHMSDMYLFEEEMQPGSYYLIYENELEREDVEILYRFKDKTLKKEMLLVKII